MKVILITQRVERIENYNEVRDALDQNWIKFIQACGFLPLPLPNNLVVVKEIIATIEIAGIILTGGNDLLAYGGDAPERDLVEQYLISHSLKAQIPLIGVCRGMQVIQNYYQIKLKRISGHVSEKFEILLKNKKMVVNSYHNFGTTNSIPELEIFAISEDHVIKGITHCEKQILGIMWHPERMIPFRNFDIEMIQKFIIEEDFKI